MVKPKRSRPGFKSMQDIRKNKVHLTRESLIKTRFLEGAQEFPLVVEPVIDFQAAGWAEKNKDQIEAWLLQYGAVLFRNFNLPTTDHFQKFVEAISPNLLEYKDRAAPREVIKGRIYNTTYFASDQWIPLHHENAYAKAFPQKIFFYCDLPAEVEGYTPIVDDRTFLEKIPEDVLNTFLEKKLLYVRNYGEGVDMTWRDAYQMDDPLALEAYLTQSGVDFEWTGKDRLRTRQVRHVVATHPQTGHRVWFNHAHLFHISNNPPLVQEALLEEFAPHQLPRNVFYGDGTPIENQVLEQIRQAYKDSAVLFPWQKGDLLLLDNILVSHGRTPFSGDRRICVAMTDAISIDECGGPQHVS